MLNMIEDQNWQHTKHAKLKPMTNRTTMNPAALVTMDIRKTADPQDGTHQAPMQSAYHGCERRLQGAFGSVTRCAIWQTKYETAACVVLHSCSIRRNRAFAVSRRCSLPMLCAVSIAKRVSAISQRDPLSAQETGVRG